ncbi:purine-nucleoside phosphorylase [Planctomycetaceae bacterium SH139]
MVTPHSDDLGDKQNPLATTLQVIRSRIGAFQPRFGIVLGSGLGGLADEITAATRIDFGDLPNFVPSTAAGHAGQLVTGLLAGVPVVALAGRLHRYEGWSVAQVTFPIRVLRALGAGTLIASNAAGGLRHHFAVGDIMVIRDHINWLGSPVLGFAQSQVDDATATAAVNTTAAAVGVLARGRQPYDAELADLALAAGRRGDFAVHQGTYLATLGPSYETPAEYRMMRRIGADCVGMSTVPEVLMAQQLGMRVLALSMISNVARPDAPQETLHQEVLQIGRQAEPNMSYLVRAVVQCG